MRKTEILDYWDPKSMPQEGRRYEFCPDLFVFFREQVCCLWTGEDP